MPRQKALSQRWQLRADAMAAIRLIDIAGTEFRCGKMT